TATKTPASSAQVTHRKPLVTTTDRLSHTTPSKLVTTSPVLLAIARNIFRAGDQHTEFQLRATNTRWLVQLMPSGDVMMLVVAEPFEPTAQNNPSSRDQHTDRQPMSAAEVRVVQLIPSGDVITRLAVPLSATATSRPTSGDQQSDRHAVAVADERVVQFTPSGDGKTRSVPLPPKLIADTPTNNPSSFAHTMLPPSQWTPAPDAFGEVCVVQFTPSGEVMMRLSASPVFATAQKSLSSGDQHTARQPLLTDDACEV